MVSGFTRVCHCQHGTGWAVYGWPTSYGYPANSASIRSSTFQTFCLHRTLIFLNRTINKDFMPLLSDIVNGKCISTTLSQKFQSKNAGAYVHFVFIYALVNVNSQGPLRWHTKGILTFMKMCCQSPLYCSKVLCHKCISALGCI